MNTSSEAKVYGTKRMRNIYRELMESKTLDAPIWKLAKAYSWTIAVIIGLAMLATSSSGPASLWAHLFALRGKPTSSNIFNRSIASMAFPQVSTESDTDDIISNYTTYLRFVLEVGSQTDSRTAQRLAQTFEKLRGHYPQGAALFLKGLRFEMIQKEEFMGASPAALSSSSPEMRRWVGKFMKDWLRECDEQLFRSVALARSSRNSD